MTDTAFGIITGCTYYVWTKKEIQDILGIGKDFDAFCLYYDVTDGGNWESRTILCSNVEFHLWHFMMEENPTSCTM